MKYEWKKSEKNIYGVKQKAEFRDIPEQSFITIKGEGDPNEEGFSKRISALYSVAYSIKMLFKSRMKDESDEKLKDFTVYPLEGEWEEKKEGILDKSKLRYTLMIKQADFISDEIFNTALLNVKKKKPDALYGEISLEKFPCTKAIQILHIGSYDEEPLSFEKMDELTKELKLRRNKKSHREIYLSDKNRTAEEKRKTILRYTVE